MQVGIEERELRVLNRNPSSSIVTKLIRFSESPSAAASKSLCLFFFLKRELSSSLIGKVNKI
jgi:hypothetical protein